MAGAGIMATGLPASDIPFYLGIMAAGLVISVVIGACIGVFASNQMSATSLFVPVMMVFSFSPMLAMFNDKIEKVARIFYTQQLRVLMNRMSFEGIKPESILIPLHSQVQARVRHPLMRSLIQTSGVNSTVLTALFSTAKEMLQES